MELSSFSVRSVRMLLGFLGKSASPRRLSERYILEKLTASPFSYQLSESQIQRLFTWHGESFSRSEDSSGAQTGTLNYRTGTPGFKRVDILVSVARGQRRPHC